MNNSKILGIKNAKLSRYYFYKNLNIWRDFQICISVPLKDTNNYNLRHKLFFKIPRNETLSNGFESISYLGPKIWELLPSEIQEFETLFEFKNKVKSWYPINCLCKLSKTYIGGVGYAWMMEQYTLCDRTYESIRNVGLLNIKENLQSRF